MHRIRLQLCINDHNQDSPYIRPAPLFDLLGKSSYVFYLTHVGIISEVLLSVIGRNITALFIIFNLLSIVLYLLVEHPMHRWLIAWFRKRNQRTHILA